MKKMLDTHVPQKIAIAVMICGFIVGVAIGYRWFDGKNNPERESPSFTQWIFPSMSPLVSPPAEFPVVQPPTAPPPQ